ncbi:peptide-N4-(N-acetyl-beta-glucosaminyl)asparagine amidase A-like [Quercus lobata]|uniref:Peptide N-acetyl-beta-D-glucosaminyl asparaginase amidase A N-terminal domain-containing protein n=1 Tax=Quercus lobata TaxID=97700 RepID=A0A7N2L237_QUELO|nr:peptide-N4-(N-acetyl-beta-glucosaminyl)asparagine amidase A-like [Quercus lobata]
MASSMLYSVLFLLLHQSLFSTANLFHKKGLFRQELDFSESQHKPLNDTTPTLFFEVTKPIKLPNTKPCSYHILQHDFGYTYDKPPVLANYTPTSHCPSQKFSKIVLQWNATCKGRQFDRIFGVWLGGAELFRSCTAEPRATGIVWNVEKDITRYYSLLMKNQTLAVYLGNLITSTYTGVYHVNITIQFYPAEKNGVSKLGDLVSKYHSPANLIIPFSQNLPLNNGLWFEIENSTDIALREFKIPQNAYRAVLEVYVSFHENDESWYSNLYNEYIEANNITGVAGNGPFREVVVCLDGQVVGAIWPFTVIFTGGVNPLLWRPITGIGSFDLPSYNIEITPFLGKIIDGKSHKFGFSVTNALNVWYIDANLHLWLDSKTTKIDGKILEHVSSPLVVSLVSDFKGLNGTFLSSVSRSVSSTGWVMSSHGNITTNWIQNFSYNNSMLIESNGDLQIVNQTIHFNDSVHAKLPSSSVFSTESHKKFDLYSYYNELDEGNGTSVSSENVTLGFFEKKSKDVGFGFSKCSLENVQNGQGNMAVKNNLVVSGLGSTQQVYKYDGSDFCYFRNVSSSNYTILYDELGNICHKGTRSNSGFRLGNMQTFPA